MATKTRTLVRGVVAAAVILAADRVNVAQGQAPAQLDKPVAREEPRVRSDDPDVSELIRRTTDLSPTFRRLVDEIQATNGVVYVQRGRCGHGVRACLLFWMTVAGPNRILRVVLDDSKADVEGMAVMAHELKHALEVLSEPNVKSGSDMYFFYKFGRSIKGETFETRSAIEAGNAVRKEVTRSRSQRN